MGKRYIAPSVNKAFDILRAISSSRGGIGINKLAKDLMMAKSTVHGITSTLERLGAVMRNPLTKKYSLGFTLFELGRFAYSQNDLKDVARPVMEELMEKSQESVFLGVLNREHVTILDIVESMHDLKITSPIGTTIPLLAGATGKVILACLNEDKAVKIVRERGIQRYTKNTITDIEQYMQEVRRARENGYATDYEEYILGVRAVSSPIKGNRNLISAIWVVGFRTGLDNDKMKAIVGLTKRAAETISRRIEG
ncbi:MAG TPA: IclR family transcriptional regulator [Desulfobacteraceae bacterium]|nr:IclR family transcriptional regulator [Desulfobacteraceae bacterium]